MTEGVYVLLNANKNLYASLFDFADPWKIDILEFLEKNYMNDLSLEEIANYTGRSLATFKRDFSLLYHTFSSNSPRKNKHSPSKHSNLLCKIRLPSQGKNVSLQPVYRKCRLRGGRVF